MQTILLFLKKYKNIFLLLLRIGIGSLLIASSYPKMVSGPSHWKILGMNIGGSTGINFLPAFWGFMASFTEFVGAICITIGLFTRLFSSVLATTFTFISLLYLINGHLLYTLSILLKNGIALSLLIYLGAGKYSIDQKIVSEETAKRNEERTKKANY